MALLGRLGRGDKGLNGVCISAVASVPVRGACLVRGRRGPVQATMLSTFSVLGFRPCATSWSVPPDDRFCRPAHRPPASASATLRSCRSASCGGRRTCRISPGSWSAACPLRTSSRHCRSVRSPWRHSRNGTPGVTPTDAAVAAPLPRRASTLAPATGPVSSTVSQVHAGCKHRSSSVGAVDQTAASGAKQQPARHACFVRRSSCLRARGADTAPQQRLQQPMPPGASQTVTFQQTPTACS